MVNNLRISQHRWRWMLLRQDYVLRALNQVPWLAIAGRWLASHSADIRHRARRANKTEDMIVVVSAPPHGTLLGSHQSRSPLACCLFPETLVSAAGSIAQGLWPFPPFSQTYFFCFFAYFFFFSFFMRNYSSGAYFCFIKSKLELWGWCRVHFFVVEVQIYISTSSSNLSEMRFFFLLILHVHCLRPYECPLFSAVYSTVITVCPIFMFVKRRQNL